jgi:hypothetical protein
MDLFVPEIAAARGHHVVATPHNLEALVREPDGAPRFSGVEPELRALARADEVFCISEEEAWLLRTLGIPASCLPYFPPAAVHEELLRIRSVRAGRPPGRRWLMLGTAGNVPTRIGMMEGLTWLGGLVPDVPLDLDVVGFGTEGLHLPSAPRSFVFHGAVSPAKLSELMSSCRGVVVHHAPTSGALTRLVECAVAGIPVVANADATKGQHVQGVSTYHDRAELAALLSAPLAVPQAPDRPRRQEQRFVSALAATHVADCVSATL